MKRFLSHLAHVELITTDLDILPFGSTRTMNFFAPRISFSRPASPASTARASTASENRVIYTFASRAECGWS
jgi:hypothetical protein